MKILLFGRTGQVAREVQRRAEVIALGRAEADLADPPACAAAIAAHAPDLVINAAAWTAVDDAETHEAAATVINAAAPGAMAQACARQGIPFVHVSSDYVFDGAGQAAFAPDHPTAPLGAYGRSKLAGEDAVRAARGRAAILRTSWVFSAHGANFVRTMLRLSQSRDALTVVADQVGGPTPAGDIAAALLAMGRAMAAGQPGGTYHFSGAPDVSWADFAREIFAQSGRATQVADIPTREYPTPAARPLNSRLDCASLAADFAITRPDWRAGLAAVLQELGDAA